MNSEMIYATVACISIMGKTDYFALYREQVDGVPTWLIFIFILF